MDMELRNKQKKRGFKRFLSSFKYSFQGLIYTYRAEQSLVLHLIITIVVIIGGLIFKINLTEWLFCLLFIGLILAAELINTSVEAVVDLICPKIHPLAKIAKDTASAAVFVFSLVAFISGMVIFLPKIIIMIESFL